MTDRTDVPLVTGIVLDQTQIPFLLQYGECFGLKLRRDDYLAEILCNRSAIPVSSGRLTAMTPPYGACRSVHKQDPTLPDRGRTANAARMLCLMIATDGSSNSLTSSVAALRSRYYYESSCREAAENA